MPSDIVNSQYYHSDSIINMFYNGGYPFVWISDLPINITFNRFSSLFSRSLVSAQGYESGYTYSLNIDGSWSTSNQYTIAAYPPQDSISAVIGIYIGGDFSFWFGSDYYIVSNSTAPSTPSIPSYPDGSGNTFVPDANSGEVNWPNFIYLITSWFFYNGIMRTNLPGEPATWNNSNWISIADALTYQFLCQTNLGQNDVTWGNNTYPNYLYQVTELMYMIDESIGRFSDNIEDLDIESIGSDIADIKSNIELAFPSDESAINNVIAETVLDDTDSTGLTASKVTQGKHALDDNASIFALDTSGGEYSSPADAITHGDWSFWSQTTVDNLGSRYTFSIESLDAELMDDNDIYDENISALRRLIGW